MLDRFNVNHKILYLRPIGRYQIYDRSLIPSTARLALVTRSKVHCVVVKGNT